MVHTSKNLEELRLEKMKLYSKSLREFPNSQRQLMIISQIDKVIKDIKVVEAIVSISKHTDIIGLSAGLALAKNDFRLFVEYVVDQCKNDNVKQFMNNLYGKDNISVILKYHQNNK